MTVRRKTTVIVAITYLCLMAVVYAVARTVILGNARQDEHLSGNRNMQRVLDVMEERMSALDRFSQDRSALRVLLRHTDLTQSTSGVVMVPEGPLLTISRAVLKTSGEGPPRGILSCRSFFGSLGSGLGGKTRRLQVDVQRLDQPGLSADAREAMAHLARGGATYIAQGDNSSIRGYARIDDLFGNQAFLPCADIPRKVFINGLISQCNFLFTIVVTGIAFCVVVLLLLERMMISPLSQLNRAVGRIAAEGDVSARIAHQGKDELSGVALSNNCILDSLEFSRKQKLQMMDGFEAVAALRERERETGIHLPVISLTAHALKDDRDLCLQAGMDGYLTKPIRGQELDTVLGIYTVRKSQQSVPQPDLAAQWN